jgi:hypothetical protein
MADEIEEFIRRAAERRKQQAQGQQPARRPPAQQPAAQKPPAQRPPAPPKPRPPLAPPMSPRPVVEAEVVSAELAEHVSSHVASHLDTHQFAERAAHLGEETALSDDRLEARLHQKFDHRVGRLTKTSLNQVEDIPDPGQRLAAAPAVSLSPQALVQMLQSPQQLRGAIILKEVLDRPEHNWE